MKICIDAGHGLNTEGKRTPAYEDGHQIREFQFNKPTALKLKEELERCGFATVLTMNGDTDVPLETRVNIANEANADLFVSIHYNAYLSTWECCKGGVETYYYTTSTNGKKLAEIVHNELIQGTPQVNRGVKTCNFYVCKHTNMPAILVECGFMDVRKEADLMLNESFQHEVASEIARGICKYLNVAYVSQPQPIIERKDNVNIKEFQETLNRLGFKDYEDKPLEVDGVYGKRTESAKAAAKAFFNMVNQ